MDFMKSLFDDRLTACHHSLGDFPTFGFLAALAFAIRSIIACLLASSSTGAALCSRRRFFARL